MTLKARQVCPSNLSFRDPQGSKTDAELILALQQAHLLPPSGSSVPADRKFELEAVIREGGRSSASLGDNTAQTFHRGELLVRREAGHRLGSGTGQEQPGRRLGRVPAHTEVSKLTSWIYLGRSNL
jgi:hypothetical protein